MARRRRTPLARPMSLPYRASQSSMYEEGESRWTAHTHSTSGGGRAPWSKEVVARWKSRRGLAEKRATGQEGEGGGRGGSGRARLGRATVSEQGKPAGLVPWRMRVQGVQGCGQESEPRTRGARGHLRMACASAGPFRSSGTGTVLR